MLISKPKGTIETLLDKFLPFSFALPSWAKGNPTDHKITKEWTGKKCRFAQIHLLITLNSSTMLDRAELTSLHLEMCRFCLKAAEVWGRTKENKLLRDDAAKCNCHYFLYVIYVGNRSNACKSDVNFQTIVCKRCTRFSKKFNA